MRLVINQGLLKSTATSGVTSSMSAQATSLITTVMRKRFHALNGSIRRTDQVRLRMAFLTKVHFHASVLARLSHCDSAAEPRDR